MDPDVTLQNGWGVPPSCALLGGFAVGTRVWLLWHLMQNVSEDACARFVAGLPTVSLYKCNFLFIFATADKISTDLEHFTVSL